MQVTLLAHRKWSAGQSGGWQSCFSSAASGQFRTPSQTLFLSMHLWLLSWSPAPDACPVISVKRTWLFLSVYLSSSFCLCDCWSLPLKLFFYLDVFVVLNCNFTNGRRKLAHELDCWPKPILIARKIVLNAFITWLSVNLIYIMVLKGIISLLLGLVHKLTLY